MRLFFFLLSHSFICSGECFALSFCFSLLTHHVAVRLTQLDLWSREREMKGRQGCCRVLLCSSCDNSIETCALSSVHRYQLCERSLVQTQVVVQCEPSERILSSISFPLLPFISSGIAFSFCLVLHSFTLMTRKNCNKRQPTRRSSGSCIDNESISITLTEAHVS